MLKMEVRCSSKMSVDFQQIKIELQVRALQLVVAHRLRAASLAELN
jgi:hypothetical protein